MRIVLLAFYTSWRNTEIDSNNIWCTDEYSSGYVFMWLICGCFIRKNAQLYPKDILYHICTCIIWANTCVQIRQETNLLLNIYTTVHTSIFCQFGEFGMFAVNLVTLLVFRRWIWVINVPRGYISSPSTNSTLTISLAALPPRLNGDDTCKVFPFRFR